MGTHPIFESDFDCLTDLIKKKMNRQPRNIMPGGAQTGLGLSYNAQNTSGILQHPIEKCAKTIVDQDTQHNMNMALKNQGRGFALGLQMEHVMVSGRPKVPGRSMKTLGADILTGRSEQITLEDYIGETEGVEMLHTFTYPM